jgi:hypothetical protein
MTDDESLADALSVDIAAENDVTPSRQEHKRRHP